MNRDEDATRCPWGFDAAGTEEGLTGLARSGWKSAPSGNRPSGPDIRFGIDAATAAVASMPEPPATEEDPRVVRALEEYLALVERGSRPDRHQFLARHEEIAAKL